MNETIKRLRGALSKAVKREPYEGMLFSGGLDTSILASLNPKITGITVTLESKGEDIYYSKLLANSLNIKQILREVEVDEAIERIPEVIQILKSFDPAIPNDLVVLFGLELARDLGLDTVGVGDGSDELFGGYSFMKNINDLAGYIKRISESMGFSSNEIGRFFGIKIIQPYLDKEIIELALNIPVEFKIREGYGKWILRKAFEGLLPSEIIWQDKRPLEYGSGMTKLREIISAKISDDEFLEKKKFYPVKFFSKEHFYYYKIYKDVVGEIPKPKEGENECPSCGTYMRKDKFHCKLCGGVINRPHHESQCQ